MAAKRLINTELDSLSALHDLRKNMQLFCQNQDNQDACNKVMEAYDALLSDELLRKKINEAIQECIEKALTTDDFNFYKFKTTSDEEDKARRSSANKSKNQNAEMSALYKQISEEIAFQANIKNKDDFKGLDSAEITAAKFENNRLIIEIKGKKQPLCINFLPYKGKLLSPLNWYNTSRKTGKKNGIMPKNLKLLEDSGENGYVFQETSKPEDLGKKYTLSEYRKFLGLPPSAELTKRQENMFELLNKLTLNDQKSLKNAYRLHMARLKKYKEISDYISETSDKIAILRSPDKLRAMLKAREIDDFTHNIQRRFIILIQHKETWADFAKDKEDNSRRFSRYEMLENNFIASKRELFTEALQKDLTDKSDVRNLVTKLFSQIRNSAKPALDNELCAEIIARGIFNEAVINYNPDAQKFQKMNTLLNEMGVNIDFKSLPVVKAPSPDIADFAEQRKIDRQNFEELKRTAEYISQEKEFNTLLKEHGITKPADSSTHHYIALKYNAFVEPELNNNSLLVKTARANPWNYDGHITTHMFDTAGEFLIKNEQGDYSLSNFNVLRNRFNSGEVLEIQAPILQIKDEKGEYKDLLSLGENGKSGHYFSDNSTKPIIKVPPYINEGNGGNSLKNSIEK